MARILSEPRPARAEARTLPEVGRRVAAAHREPAEGLTAASYRPSPAGGRGQSARWRPGRCRDDSPLLRRRGRSTVPGVIGDISSAAKSHRRTVDNPRARPLVLAWSWWFNRPRINTSRERPDG